MTVPLKLSILDLNRDNCNILRGISILLIATHNFCHQINFAVKENEYLFKEKNYDDFVNIIHNFNIYEFPIHLLSFIGHYGVPIFLFLTGYGLIKKYGTTNIKKLPFIKYEYLKLLRLMLPGFLLFLCIYYYRKHLLPLNVKEIGAELLMISNMFHWLDFRIKPGPYWYFGLTFELYLIYIFLINTKNSNLYQITIKILSLIIICYILQAICIPDSKSIVHLRYNFFHAMLPFGIGMLWGLYTFKELYLNKVQLLVLVLLSAYIVFIFSSNFYLWLLIPLFVIIFILLCAKMIEKTPLDHFFSYIGKFSAVIFVTHPIARELVFWKFKNVEIYQQLLLYILITIGLTIVFHFGYKYIPKPQNI